MSRAAYHTSYRPLRVTCPAHASVPFPRVSESHAPHASSCHARCSADGDHDFALPSIPLPQVVATEPPPHSPTHNLVLAMEPASHSSLHKLGGATESAQLSPTLKLVGGADPNLPNPSRRLLGSITDIMLEEVEGQVRGMGSSPLVGLVTEASQT